ncbi:MAG: carboxylating nicotinate-nucleotide diphosphorylase [Acidobacteriota bacterium]|nr:carboxylating nicotinate-nucleotide diphosphorylase [Acidobacteriota bacterium]MDH3786528.1 carboxylating nicotinate-nucleotide diphosphorylase [Acidobacteriota bacterium]
MPTLPPELVEDVVRRALAEDLGHGGDLTTDPAILASLQAEAEIVARQDLVVAGLPLVVAVFAQLDPLLEVCLRHREGDPVRDETVVATLKGSAAPMLQGERTALNFVMRMSGVATATAEAVHEVAGTGVQILDTRKTIPGWRVLDKYAVRIGGGTNHRMGLYDAVMIKDTHLATGRPIMEWVAAALASGVTKDRITVEVRDLDQLQEAIASGAGRALLDNMGLDALRASVEAARGLIVLEASGGLMPGRLRDVAETGVDCMSLGYLTHSAGAADLSMRLSMGR